MEVPTVAIIMDKLQSTAVIFVRENVITKLAKLSMTNLITQRKFCNLSFFSVDGNVNSLIYYGTIVGQMRLF